MKIRFLQDTYIRQEARIGGKPPLGVIYKGTEMDVHEDFIPGDEIGGINIWYCDMKGWFYWSGATQVIARRRPTPVSGSQLEGGATVAVPRADTTVPVAAGQGGVSWPHGGLERTSGDKGSTTSDSVANSQELFGQPDTSLRNPVAQLWENASEDKLNWGVRNYLIAENWWKARRLTGRNVRIAILSTGGDLKHPDIPNVEDFFQVRSGETEPIDYHGLGTQAAIVAAGSGKYALGVAPEARLLLGKIGDQDHLIQPDDMLAGLEWAINKQADIVAILAYFQHLTNDQVQRLKTLVQRAKAQNTWLVAPVGTWQGVRPQSFHPARTDGIFSVGAHDQYGQSCSFSARSYDLDVMAPGEGLLVASSEGQQGVNIKSTAIATAFTTGLMALVRQANPLPAEEAYDLLRETAVAKNFGKRGQDTTYGFGLLNPIGLLDRL